MPEDTGPEPAQTLPGSDIALLQTLRSGGSAPLCWITAVIVVVAVVSLFVQAGPADAIALSGIPLAFGAAVWLAFYFPRVELSPAGLRIVNVFSVTTLPWPAVESFDLRFGLTVHTRWERKYSAWALPGSKRRPRQQEGQKKKAVSAVPDPKAQAVVDYFSALRTLGALDDPRIDPTPPVRQWIPWAVAVAGIALVWAVLGILSL
ncbi:PH domain-containing protein [Brevibacterium sp. 50QC2O2]|uniref:PH domain-containing protein n=1 Tax=Brevibacterium TaxID=1696 RepID=UPI00211C9A2C|nr:MULTISPECIES: PH domain-containing protein [unclassified Brevibacterium]MCQ9368407.1 PH domain-containing protein [Brevibacterium sp. 91QC2O2]MCQ9384735.1 PH domain-containing protein [Brevibacterium sp. 68QC2CO]MCQ9387498.1 PH domain-containing protein [Brevibacterium sp. 50QC2O2]